MHWVTSVMLLLVATGGVHLQCFSPNGNIQDGSVIPDVSNITEFGIGLYKVLSSADQTKNFFFSPYSIWITLSMTYFGSSGNTQRELETVLGFRDKISAYRLWKALGQRYNKNDAQYTFNVANRVYLNESLGPNYCLSNTFPTELQFLDFTDSSASVKEINNFVSNTTKGLIRKILQEPDLRNTIMVLVNAVYFKGTWSLQFDPQSTIRSQFYFSHNDTALVDMMYQKADFNYGESRQIGARVLELPYAGGDLSMFILLPSEDRPFGTRFEHMVSNLNASTLRKAIELKNMVSQPVHVYLPKFKFEKDIKNLITGLQAMGIKDLFSPFHANLMDFALPRNTHVGKAAHKAFIKINEEGTEAAAATALGFDTRIARRQVFFECDEPFIFLILENQTKNILFMGAIKDPHSLEAP